MEMKLYVWGGMFASSGVSSMLPLLWGADALSFSSVVLSFVGGAVGLVAGYYLGKSLGA